jgi:hypothetical protein
LEPKDIEAIARRVVELLDERATTRRYVDAAELAAMFGHTRDWVYDHQRELGAIRLAGGGLRFDVDEVLRIMRAGSKDPEPRRPQRRRPGGALIPYDEG